MNLSDHCHPFEADSLLVILADSKVLNLSTASQWLPFSSQSLQIPVHIPFSHHLLGQFQERPCYALILEQQIDLGTDYYWDSARNVILAGQLQGDAFSLVSAALQIDTWHRDHQFCGRCGQPTALHPTERAMVCEPCAIHYYPRLSPCMITVVTRGEYCLLASNSRYKPGFYSALAGFVEAGETLEQCLHREVMEEVGIRVKNLSYFGSQPWPFPGQLMVGFFAEYDSGEICVDGEEITDARWWHYRELPTVPPSTTLSGQLIQTFVDCCNNNIHSR